MNWISANKKTALLMIALFASLMLATSVAAHAAANGGTLRVMTEGETHAGVCCTVWSDSVEVMQPEKPLPIVITWSTDYRSSGAALVGLRLNNGPCTFYGPAFLPAAAPASDTLDLYASTTMQWVVMPGDYGLVKGPNSIRLCGGGVTPTDSITLGFYTLTVRLDK
jgi:hypothetical protein